MRLITELLLPRTSREIPITWTGRGVDTTQSSLAFSNEGSSLTLSLGNHSSYIHCSRCVLVIGVIIYGARSVVDPVMAVKGQFLNSMMM